MRNISILLLSVYLLIFSLSCSVTTRGGSWEIFTGVRITQHSIQQPSIGIESQVLDGLIEALTDGKITPAEKEIIIKIIWWTAKWYFNIPGVMDLF
ncbi:hypothetical protein LCGC14_0142730 [marine sediment metagenome]|uniref:Uncharacterized protein n=1 Tax=marine sediment metagenome TaxID=412755 RepID=A0A0F9Y2W3_9ZZZZ